MRRLVVFDEGGTIIASGPHPEEHNPFHEGQSLRFGVSALPGQRVGAIELPEEMASFEHLDRLHRDYRVEEAGESLRLRKLPIAEGQT